MWQGIALGLRAKRVEEEGVCGLGFRVQGLWMV